LLQGLCDESEKRQFLIKQRLSSWFVEAWLYQ
jgi:hypothetical protein